MNGYKLPGGHPKHYQTGVLWKEFWTKNYLHRGAYYKPLYYEQTVFAVNYIREDLFNNNTVESMLVFFTNVSGQSGCFLGSKLRVNRAGHPRRLDHTIILSTLPPPGGYELYHTWSNTNIFTEIQHNSKHHNCGVSQMYSNDSCMTSHWHAFFDNQSSAIINAMVQSNGLKSMTS